MAIVRVLHLVGSPTSAAYCELSELYASGCINALSADAQIHAKYAFVVAHVTPDGLWRFPLSLSRAALDAAQPMALDAALAHIAALHLDIALPQMFCLAGMTQYRALLDQLGIPYLGNKPYQMALTADKARAKAVVAAAGVRVPQAELLSLGELPTLAPPVVVKPNNSDNSDGVTLVMHSADYPAALALAFSFADAVLVETYVPLGREVRCGIVERGGQLQLLPLEEYFVDAVSRPIRTRTDKLKRDTHNQLTLAAKQASQAWIVAVDDPIVERVWAAARLCHAALGCQQYSLFDFRIDPDGEPWFLEAGLYCSFSPKSVVVAMMAAAGVPLQEFFDMAVAQVLAGPTSLSAPPSLSAPMYPTHSPHPAHPADTTQAASPTLFIRTQHA